MVQVGSPTLAIGRRINPYEYRCEKGPHSSVAIARVLSGKCNHPLHQGCVYLGLRRAVALTGAGLVHYPASPTLGDPKQPTNLLDGGPLPGRAQKFPRLTSFRMS